MMNSAGMEGISEKTGKTIAKIFKLTQIFVVELEMIFKLCADLRHQ
jgi:hypothetical protein